MALYKYLHPDRIDVLKGLRIRFSAPAALNDPFELKPHFSGLASHEFLESAIRRLLPNIVREEFEKIPHAVQLQASAETLHEAFLGLLPRTKVDIKGMTDALVPMLKEVIARKFDELIGILCLSESSDSLLMWAHYADSHQGFVVEFDEKSPFFDRRVSDEDELRYLRKVTYSSQRPSLPLSDVIDFSPFMTKGADWEYEAEWRMIQSLDEASTIIKFGAQSVHLFEFPAQAITGVILGCRMAVQKKDEIRQILSDASHFSHVRCVEAEIDNEHYRIRV